MNKVSFSFQFLTNLSNTYLRLVSSLEGYINAMAHEQINEQVLIRSCERMSKCSYRLRSLGFGIQLKPNETRHIKHCFKVVSVHRR